MKKTVSTTDTSFSNDTSQRTLKDWGKALVVLVIGLTVAHLGVTLFLLSALGTDPFTVLVQGLSRTIGLSVGTVHVIVLCLLLVIMAASTKGYLKLGTVVCAFLGGPIIDFFTWLLENWIHGASSLVFRGLAMVAGCIILSLGMSIVINSNAGTGPNDLVALILTDKLGRFQFRWVRVACDVVFIVSGFLLGGTVGVGTVVAAFLTGPAVQFWLPRSGDVIRRVLTTNMKGLGK